MVPRTKEPHVSVLSLSVPFVLIAALTACGSDGGGGADSPDGASQTTATESVEPESFAASGVFVLHGTGDESYGWNKEGSPCEGQGGYSDIVEGSQVVITNSSGEAIALGALGPGSTVEDNAWYQCHFSFAVEDVPADGTIYGVEISGRGSVPFSMDDADALALELGS
jgi:hypothetical protein